MYVLFSFSTAEAIEHSSVTHNSTFSNRVTVSATHCIVGMCSYTYTYVWNNSVKVLHNLISFVIALMKVLLTTILPHPVAYGFVRALNGPLICKI